MNWRRIWGAALVLGVAIISASAQAPWVNNVSGAERSKTNPYGNEAEAIAAGSRLFADHCAKCHGADALGTRNRPSLRTPEVQQAADGEIFWLLKNGALRHGMPSWSSLPEPMRWQIIAYIKSLGQYTARR
jgi:mono/diheme cytochrome c family protein